MWIKSRAEGKGGGHRGRRQQAKGRGQMPEVEKGHCEPGNCGLRSNFLSLRWRRSFRSFRSFRLFCLGFLSGRKHRSMEVLRDEGSPHIPSRL